MLEVVPYKLDEIKNELKIKAIEEFGLNDAEYEGSNVSQLINLLAYSLVMNNTNLTFGLNEMFITQAQDRRNVIKHARQMGYSHKRNTSYQYKIKLQTAKEGSLTLSKYTNFESDGNNYVYLDEDITENFGTSVFPKKLINEYNNNVSSLYNGLNIGQIVITEEGLPLKVLEKSDSGTDRILLQSMIEGEIIPEFSETQTQELYIELPQTTTENSTGYRSFTKVGTIDTFLKDTDTNMLKVQITPEPGMVFPVFSDDEYTTIVTVDNGNFVFLDNSPLPIKYLNEIKLSKAGEYPINVDISTMELSKTDDLNRNVIFPVNGVNISDLILTSNITSDDNYNYTITPNKVMLTDTFDSIDIEVGTDRIKTILAEDLEIDYENNKVIVPKISSPYDAEVFSTNGIMKILDNYNEVTIDGIIAITITNVDTGDSFTKDEYNWDIDGTVTLLDENGDIDSAYDSSTYSIKIDYLRIYRLDILPITLNYIYDFDITDYTAEIKYSYDLDNDGYLDKSFFLSDLRGEYIQNETDGTNWGNWNGFKASSYNEETNVLYFDVSRLVDTDGKVTYNNSYVPIKLDDGTIKDAEPLDKVLVSPFKKTRFCYANKITDTDTGAITYEKQENTCFGSVDILARKNEIEIIVKEGTMKRYLDLDEDGNKLYPELTVDVNSYMEDAGYFTVYAPNMEHNGVELFITRIMSDGTIEEEAAWTQRDYLLAENTSMNTSAAPLSTDYDGGEDNEDYKIAYLLWSKNRVEETFMVLNDLDYENYVNIYTYYAGTGTKLTEDFVIYMNMLESKGADGKATKIINPVDNDSFIGTNYIESSKIPFVMLAEGTTIEDTDSIRTNAPLFSNTANRAVTKLDYKTICEAQPFISAAQIWGGEELPQEESNEDLYIRLERTEEEIENDEPFKYVKNTFAEKSFGHIYFSLIPSSKPYYFTESDGIYTLDDAKETDLFFPSYYQITGKDSYTQVENQDKENQNILFSVLDKYKIITLQHNYVKSVYLDFDIDIEVLKYKFGTTESEVNALIFEACRTFMVNEVEQFDSSFYISSLTRHIDKEIGDDYGLNIDVNFSVDLYDNYKVPESGTFVNKTQDNYVTDSPITLYFSNAFPEAAAYPGFLDTWMFEMPIAMPIKNLFEESWINEEGISEPGAMIIDALTTCNTYTENGEYFIEPGDKLWMVTDDGTLIKHNADLQEVYSKANSNTQRIEISIMYKKSDTSLVEWNKGKSYRVGTYTINKDEDFIYLRLFSHGFMHFDNEDSFSETISYYDVDSRKHVVANPNYTPERTIGKLDDGTDFVVQDACFPRDYFMSGAPVVLKIKPQEMNIKVTKNTYPRLKKVEFK